MKQFRAFWAIVLSVMLTFSCTILSSAEGSAGTPYSPAAHAVDHTLGVIHDSFFSLVQRIFRKKDIPDTDTYLDTLYPGTDGTVRGREWSGGFASCSIIPDEWRCNRFWIPDKNGWCIRGLHCTGGYQNIAKYIFSDQRVNLIILSAGTDDNQNGVDDILIFASFDGVGLTAGTTQRLRKQIEHALSAYGIEHGDILALHLSATHCHNGLDIQGINISRILQCLITRQKTIEPQMEQTLAAAVVSCAKEAYAKLEPGKLSFFETEPVNGASDDLDSGVKLKNYFSCFLFKGKSGERTILANLAAHPVSYYSNYGMLYTDYPYYMSLALKDANTHLVFTQSAQSTICGPHLDYPQGSPEDAQADAWVRQYTLSREEWNQRYGKVFTSLFYDLKTKKDTFGQKDFEDHMKTAYLLAQHILAAESDAVEVPPTVRAESAHALIHLDNGLIALGSISGLLEENVVSDNEAESGYGLAAEIGLVELGNILILTAPGELSPALLLGSDPEYTGTAKWTGITSWSGQEWPYEPLEQIARKALGDPEKTVLLFGLTDDALGYIYPDICVTESILGALFYKNDPKDMSNAMLLITGKTTGSQLVTAYHNLLHKR